MGKKTRTFLLGQNSVDHYAGQLWVSVLQKDKNFNWCHKQVTDTSRESYKGLKCLGKGNTSFQISSGSFLSHLCEQLPWCSHSLLFLLWRSPVKQYIVYLRMCCPLNFHLWWRLLEALKFSNIFSNSVTWSLCINEHISIAASDPDIVVKTFLMTRSEDSKLPIKVEHWNVSFFMVIHPVLIWPW